MSDGVDVAPRCDFAIYLITDGDDEALAAADAVLAALTPGLVAVQLRAHALTAAALYPRALAWRQLTRRRGARLLVNDRLDLALASGADGVHLPARGLPAKAARRIARQLLVGASTHSLAEARMAVAGGVDFVTLSPIWPTASHPGATPLGSAYLAAAVAGVPVPLFALGGVDAAHAVAAARVGARVACLRGVLQAPDPVAAARAIAVAVGRA